MRRTAYSESDRERSGQVALDRESVAYVDAAVDRLRSILGEDLVGVYLHGSAALGDFDPKRSDIDMLAVSSRSLSTDEKRRMVAELSQISLPSPAVGLEFHAVARDALRELSRTPDFELHMSTKRAGEELHVVDGRGHGGDSDLVMHFAVLREHGVAVSGPQPAELFPHIPRDRLLEAFAGELEWAERNASPSYQVLNACRALRFFEERVLCSKTDGGQWARTRFTDPSIIDAALHHRSGRTNAHPDAQQAQKFLLAALRRLEAEQPTRLRDEQTLPVDVRATMRVFVSSLREQLGDLVSGVYVTGSATTSAYEPASSDIDAFVVLRRQLAPVELERLRDLHRDLPQKTRHGGDLEIEYVARDQLRSWGIEGEAVSISPGQELRVGESNAAADDILGARELGVPVFGPNPEEVFPEVDRETFVQSQTEWLEDLVTRDELRPDATDADYAEWTLNIARCLFGISHGHSCTKPEAAAWLARQEPKLGRALDAALAARRGEQVPYEVRAGFREYADRARQLAALQ